MIEDACIVRSSSVLPALDARTYVVRSGILWLAWLAQQQAGAVRCESDEAGFRGFVSAAVWAMRPGLLISEVLMLMSHERPMARWPATHLNSRHTTTWDMAT